MGKKIKRRGSRAGRNWDSRLATEALTTEECHQLCELLVRAHGFDQFDIVRDGKLQHYKFALQVMDVDTERACGEGPERLVAMVQETIEEAPIPKDVWMSYRAALDRAFEGPKN